jgi:hypothetical protein
MRRIVSYIVYGNNQIYYDGAKFSFITFLNWIEKENSIEIVVLTEKPEEFVGYPIKILKLSDKQIKSWSLNGSYHFRIKNRGLAYIMDSLELKNDDKILFFDTDTYFHKSPLKLFEYIQPNQALFYLNEGLIYKRKRFKVYVESLEGKNIHIEGQTYKLSKGSELWGSLMIGIMPNMRPSLEWSDLLLVKFYELVPSHTIEPFALSESLLKKYRLVEGKNFVSLYSTSRKREHAKNILSNFFERNIDVNIEKKIVLAQNVKIRRNLFIIFKQRFLRLFNK